MSRKKLDQRTFKVVFTPDGSGWQATIPDVQGCISWGRSLSEARRHIREALSTCEDVLGPKAERIAERAEFNEDFQLGADAAEAVAYLMGVQRKFAESQAELDQARRLAARALRKRAKVSLRDTSELVGVSHEKVRQLLDG